MERPIREVWQDVEVHLEFSLEFDAKAFLERHPGLALVMAELMVGPPRQWRDPIELLPFSGQHSLEANLPRLRFNPLETRRLAQELDRLFTALEFSIVGHKVIAVPPISPFQELPDGWRATSGVWLCHQPLG